MGLRPPRSACTDSYFAEPTLVRAYEGGANRVGASRLFDLSRVLDVPVGFFFDEMPAAVAASSPAQLPGSAQPLPEQELDPMVKRETLELEIGRATSELQSLMRISYAVFCLKKKHDTQYTSTHDNVNS